MSDEKSAVKSGDKNNPISLDDDDDDMRLRDPDDDKGIENNLAVAISNDECPYMGTIDRRALDFDFEKLCSVSLSKVNVYACLVCGKYFQGRGKSSHAFIHSVSMSHHVFLNLETLKFYCLPDNYEISHPSLQDILHVLRPVFTREEIDTLDKYDKPITAQDGKLYYPGIVGLNNLKHNDYCSVIFHALSHVVPLRDYFLIRSSKTNATSNTKGHLLAQRYGELLCKLWNPRAFKPHVSPHEMLQAIVLTSKKRFEFTKQGDPIVFLGWFLNSLLGTKRTKDNIIKQTFQGKIRISTRLLLPRAADDSELIPAPEEDFNTTSFLYLTLDLPTMPLFPKKDKNGKVIKPRVSVYDLLKKFDCKTQHEFRGFSESSIKRYEILQLPRYLILYYKRFSHNSFSVDKNTHIVDFTIKDLNMTHLVVPHQQNSIEDESSRYDQWTMGKEGEPAQKQHHCYRLVANIVHDGEPVAGKGTYRAQILHLGTGKWFELQDLYVTEVADNMLITLSEAYIQIWELKSP